MTSPQARLVEAARKRGQLIETHASWVFLEEEFVYKLKKPIDLEFLDFSTVNKRHVACEAELQLNSRLAPRVYLEVLPVRLVQDSAQVDDPQCFSACPHNAEIIDWVVKMRRLEENTRADHLLQQGYLDASRIDHLAALLHDFHERCETDERIQSFGSRTAVERNVKQNFEQMGQQLQAYLSAEEERRIVEHQLQFLAENEQLFSDRAKRGRVRDGHGDLRLEHVYFGRDDVEIIDCIEFNEAFRYADVGADLAFLIMDLRHHERSDLAERLLSQYAQQSFDFEIYRVVDFYEAYRAFVRGKVVAMLEEQRLAAGHPDPTLHDRAHRYFRHAVVAQQPMFEPPQIVVVGGLIASGKSTLARELSARLLCPTIDADSCRKRLAGLDPEEPVSDEPFSGLYSPEMTEMTYLKLFQLAEHVLRSGRSVILDATFRTRTSRDQLREFAKSQGRAMSFLWCDADRQTVLERLEQRSKKRTVSDGRLEILDAISKQAQPPEDREFENFLRLDTTLSKVERAKLLERFLSQ